MDLSCCLLLSCSEKTNRRREEERKRQKAARCDPRRGAKHSVQRACTLAGGCLKWREVARNSLENLLVGHCVHGECLR